MAKTSLTIGELNSILSSVKTEVAKMERGKLLRPGAHVQVEWTLAEIYKRIQTICHGG